MMASGNQKDGKVSYECDCMENCSSKIHGKEICSIGTGSDTEAVVPMWMKKCANYAKIRDIEGRTALHIVASTGNFETLGWLVKRAGSDIDKKDKNSGYTPLHRSIFFGQIHISRSLISYNADVNLKDKEGMTAFELCHMDRPRPFSFNCHSDPSELFVWGSNDNYTLGTTIEQARPVPEQLELFKKNNISIQEVVISTYHSVFLSQTGEVYTCGSGRGGKLGLTHESSVLKPEMVQFKTNSKCIKIAAGIDHTLFLMENGKVLSCGSNEYGVLGQKSSIKESHTPKNSDFSSKITIKGLVTARYHSVFYTSKKLFTCGSNRGQLGHPADGESTIYEPKIISQIILDPEGDVKYTHIACNDYATIARASSGIVFLFHKFDCHKINTKQFDVEKLQIVGGTWGDSFVSDKPIRPKEDGSSRVDDSLTIFILTTTGRLVIWRENSLGGQGTFSRVVFNTGRSVMDISDFCLSTACVVFVTKNGEAYKSVWKTGNAPIMIQSIQQRSHANSQVPQNDFQVSSGSRRTQKGKDTGNFSICLEHLKLQRIKSIYAAGSIRCDPKGKNFAIIQASPKQDLTQLPEILESDINKHFSKFFEEVNDDDSLHDVVFKVGSQLFPCHQYIVASGCPKLYNDILKKLESKPNECNPVMVQVDNIRPKVFHQILQFIYSNVCDLITPGKCFSEPEDFVRQTIDTARKLEMEYLCKELRKVEIIGELVKLRAGESFRRPMAKRYNRNLFPELCDIVLKNQDGYNVRAHRCVLIARMEYFHSMLYTHSWMEQESSKPLFLQLHKVSLETLLDFTYTDEAPNLPQNDFDALSDILVMSDTFFMERLRTITENALTDMLSLKNVTSMLYLASMCNAAQLRDSCMQFISLNLPYVLENRILEPLPMDIIKGLSKYYSNLHPTMQRRAMRRYSDIPNVQYEDGFKEISEELLNEFVQCSQDEEIRKPQVKINKSRIRLRSRTSESEADSLVKGVPLNSPISPVNFPHEGPFFNKTPYNTPQPSKAELIKSDNVISSQQGKVSTGKINIPTPAQTMKHLKNAEAEEALAKKKILNPSEFPTLNNIGDQVKTGSKDLSSKHDYCTNTVISPGNNITNISSAGSAKRKTKWKSVNINNISNNKILTEISLPGTITNQEKNSSRDPSNPWKIKNTERVSFTEIVQEEVEKKENFERAVTKSLHLMQIEDKAINELVAQYHSDDVEDGIELVTVERVFSKNYANPTWVQHQHSSVNQNHWPKFAQ